MAKHYAKTRILPRDVVQAHEAGDIHYHDLDYAPFFPMFNCMLIDLKGMLTHGFKMGNAEIDTPKSISTATAVTAQIIAQVASGGHPQRLPNAKTLLSWVSNITKSILPNYQLLFR